MSSGTIDRYTFGPYRLNVHRRVFMREDRVVPLPPKTFDLLLLLVQSDGRAVSKHELMSALWPDTFVEEANLTFQNLHVTQGSWERGRAMDRDTAEAWLSTRCGRKSHLGRGRRAAANSYAAA